MELLTQFLLLNQNWRFREVVMDKAMSFLEKHCLTASSIDDKEVLSFFLSEMEKGLNEDETRTMIPTHVSIDGNVKSGENVIVLDAGGTNFRTCLVSFDSEKRPQISDFRKVRMPGLEKEVSAAEFYSILADNVERLIDKADRIGFCFSYAAEITEDHDGIPIIFSKEIKAPEVIGTRLGKCLLEELERRGYDCSKKRVSVINDTVATLLAAKAARSENASSYIGFILGTGTNTAYIEKNENIKKIRADQSGAQIINVESGDFGIHVGDLDELFLKTTVDPDKYLMEKKISGAYLGPFASLVIEKAIEEGVFSSQFRERYSKIDKLNTTRMSNYLEMPHNMDYDLVRCVDGNEDDASSLYLIISSVIERAAKLTALNLAAAVIKSGAGTEPRYPVVINADGTTFYKTEGLEFYTRMYLDLILKKQYKRYYEVINVDSSPTIGAAIAGFSV